MTTTTLYQLCNRHNWFTCGTNSQYDKLFDLAREGATLEDLTMAIWICSDNVDRADVLNILKKANGPK